MLDQLNDLGYFFHRMDIILRQIIRLRIRDDEQLLLHIVKCNHLIEQHQIYIIKPFLIFRIQIQLRFTVFDVIICEIPNQSTGECRESFDLRAFVICQDFIDTGFRMLYQHLADNRSVHIGDFQLSVHTCHTKLWLVTKECIASPVFLILHTL